MTEKGCLSCHTASCQFALNRIHHCCLSTTHTCQGWEWDLSPTREGLWRLHWQDSDYFTSPFHISGLCRLNPWVALTFWDIFGVRDSPSSIACQRRTIWSFYKIPKGGGRREVLVCYMSWILSFWRTGTDWETDKALFFPGVQKNGMYKAYRTIWNLSYWTPENNLGSKIHL